MSKLSEALEELTASREAHDELFEELAELTTAGFTMHEDAGHSGTFRWCDNLVCRALNTPGGDSYYR